MSEEYTRYAADAVTLFHRGWNCAQCVAAVYADTYGLPKEDVMKMTSSFGKGIAQRQEMCGAVIGALLVLSMWYGSSEAGAANREKVYRQATHFCEQFQRRYDSVCCSELRKRRGRSACAAYVAYAVILLEQMQKEQSDVWKNKP